MATKTITLSLNGQTYTLTKNSATGKFEKEITAPTKSSYNQPEHVYAMALKAEDQAGNVTTIDKSNTTFGTKMKLDVNEKVAPVITVAKPGAGAYLTNTTVEIEFTVTDNDSGLNPDTITIKVDSSSVTPTKTKVTNGYKCTHTITLKDGSHTIELNAADFDGNKAAAKTVTFKVDTVPPTLNLSSPTDNLITNKESCVVSGTTNDVTSPACTVKITLNAVDQGAVSVAGDGTFSKTLTLKKGANTIVVRSTDKAGKYSEVTRRVEYDPDAPVIRSVEVTPNPVDAGKTFKIVVDVTD